MVDCHHYLLIYKSNSCCIDYMNWWIIVIHALWYSQRNYNSCVMLKIFDIPSKSYHCWTKLLDVWADFTKLDKNIKNQYHYLLSKIRPTIKRGTFTNWPRWSPHKTRTRKVYKRLKLHTNHMHLKQLKAIKRAKIKVFKNTLYNLINFWWNFDNLMKFLREMHFKRDVFWLLLDFFQSFWIEILQKCYLRCNTYIIRFSFGSRFHWYIFLKVAQVINLKLVFTD